MTQKDDPQALLEAASAWWSTDIVRIEPGMIEMRGYPIQDLIGKVSFPAMIWLMLRGDLPKPAQAALLEAALVSAVDHGPHAPSIAVARMAVTCGLGLNGAMASAINVLDDVHGGAGQQCMELYRDIDIAAPADEDLPEAAEAALQRYASAHGKVIPGFGHRWHKVDPRAVRLLALVDAAAREGTVRGRFARIGRLIEATLERGKGKPIPMNIDGATATIYAELGFPPPLGRGLFILSRSVGILAHAWEQSNQGGRIKGPMHPGIAYRYTGRPRRSVPPN